MLVEDLEPFAPFDQFVAAGIRRTLGAILVLVRGGKVPDQLPERL